MPPTGRRQQCRCVHPSRFLEEVPVRLACLDGAQRAGAQPGPRAPIRLDLMTPVAPSGPGNLGDRLLVQPGLLTPACTQPGCWDHEKDGSYAQRGPRPRHQPVFNDRCHADSSNGKRGVDEKEIQVIGASPPGPLLCRRTFLRCLLSHCPTLPGSPGQLGSIVSCIPSAVQGNALRCIRGRCQRVSPRCALTQSHAVGANKQMHSSAAAGALRSERHPGVGRWWAGCRANSGVQTGAPVERWSRGSCWPSVACCLASPRGGTVPPRAAGGDG
jgi:hypothetical protein